MGETQQRPFQLSFNSSLRVDFQGARVTSDGGLLVVRELDERLRLSELVDQHLSDSRMTTLGRREKCLRNRSEKGHLPALRCSPDAKPAPSRRRWKHSGPKPG